MILLSTGYCDYDVAKEYFWLSWLHPSETHKFGPALFYVVKYEQGTSKLSWLLGLSTLSAMIRASGAGGGGVKLYFIVCLWADRQVFNLLGIIICLCLTTAKDITVNCIKPHSTWSAESTKSAGWIAVNPQNKNTWHVGDLSYTVHDRIPQGWLTYDPRTSHLRQTPWLSIP